MAALDTITVRGFKSIAAIEALPLTALNVLIGANGSGKSNFIGVFSFLQAIREARLGEYVLRAGGAEKILHFGSKATPRMSFHVSFQGGKNQYDITLAATDADQLVPISERVSFWDNVRFPDGPPYHNALAPVRNEAGISDPKSEGIAHYVRRHLASWRLYHFHDTSPGSPLKKTADVNDNRFLRPDGSNLPAFLYFLKEKHAPSYSLIRAAVQRVAPFFEDFLLQPQRLNPEKIRLEWRHVSSDAYFDAASLSDGSLRFIALATLFLQPDEYRPSVILVDEPELGLHPLAITMLAALVKQASTTTQSILSTQSPLLVDHFEPEDVLVADRTGSATTLRRLDRKILEPWLQDYSLGQLWEKNELGGRPDET